jgi:hypothetical protein
MIERQHHFHAIDPRLGRHVVHDERSRNFTLARTAIDRSTWKDKAIRLYEPIPNPNQTVGCCTGVAKASQFNAIGNRKTGVVLNLYNAESIYSLASSIDIWEGQWPPTDTGSSGVASAKAAQQLGLGGGYYWEFGGADGIVQQIMRGRVMSVGTRWDYKMFDRDSDNRIHLGGQTAGGHQWVARGYDVDRDWVLGRCWWGEFKDFWIARTDLGTLMEDWGDAHWQERI